MKQIAIITRKMITGGVERVLLAMLKQFDYSKVKIDIYFEELGGDLFKELPDTISYYQIPTVTSRNLYKHPIYAYRKLQAKKKLQKNEYSYLEQNYQHSKMLMPIEKEYDIAISYHAPNTVPVFYTIDSVKAKQKYLWLHGDLDTNHGTEELALQYHEKFDRVYCVSKSIQDNFIEYHPDMKDRVFVFYNYIDIEEIKKKALKNSGFKDRYEGVRLLSIGRLSDQKGFDLAIEVCHRLVEKGYQFRWYICGEGDKRQELEKLIEKYHLENIFVLLGNQENPYTYLKNCDLYVQTSRFEGYCTTTNEARMLYKPVITTNVSGAYEQFEDNVNGWVVPIDIDEIENRIIYCLEHPEKMDEVVKKLQNMKFQTAEEINRLLQ